MLKNSYIKTIKYGRYHSWSYSMKWRMKRKYNYRRSALDDGSQKDYFMIGRLTSLKLKYVARNTKIKQKKVKGW